ncbi:hypothetical protein RHMOL_Rhmol11G0287000 [Rhododendron molle]|uniref:Uncharacterized protein n=1 Tax=Rhododendron molle TaxID=49168 RepID=A0ACC0LX41_RHOML|nr:hypothetical protein RHMOL_Rhmol11G0287000 [Rhododendron molle]
MSLKPWSKDSLNVEAAIREAAIRELLIVTNGTWTGGPAEGAHLHIIHLSDARSSLELIKEAKRNDDSITVETCTHYLAFSVEEIQDGDTRFKCRDSANKETLWEALMMVVLWEFLFPLLNNLEIRCQHQRAVNSSRRSSTLQGIMFDQHQHPTVMQKVSGQPHLSSNAQMRYGGYVSAEFQFLMGGVSAAVSKTAAAPIEHVKLLIASIPRAWLWEERETKLLEDCINFNKLAT